MSLFVKAILILDNPSILSWYLPSIIELSILLSEWPIVFEETNFFVMRSSELLKSVIDSKTIELAKLVSQKIVSGTWEFVPQRGEN